MNTICLVVDRLHVGHIGAYGNSWIETPAMDRLASEAFLFDQMLIDSPRLEKLYRSYWQGWHALCPQRPPADHPALAALLREAGVNTALLTDERLVSDHPLAVEFDELIEIDPPWEPKGAQQIEQTRLAQCVVQAIDWLQTAREPFLLWCHLGSLGTAWDAPLEFRRTYWEEGDPEPPETAEVPEKVLQEGHDPDELLGVSQAYAGQVSLLDTCLGALCEFLDGGPAGWETMLLLTSSRGFPLGEHGRVGPRDGALYSELLHVPLMLRFPDGMGAAVRSRALVEPADLWATLLDWHGAGPAPASPTAGSLMGIVREETAGLRDRLCIAGDDLQRAIRTPAWHLREGVALELFAKPDDRWDTNDVSVRCRDVAQDLQETLSQYVRALRTGRVSDLAPLPAVLLSGLE